MTKISKIVSTMSSLEDSGKNSCEVLTPVFNCHITPSFKSIEALINNAVQDFDLLEPQFNCSTDYNDDSPHSVKYLDTLQNAAIKSNSVAQPSFNISLENYTEEESEKLIKLQNILQGLPNVPLKKEQLLANARDTLLTKNNPAKAISDLAESIIHALPLMVLKGQLYVFENPIWVCNDSNDLILTLRNKMPQDDTLTYLHSKGYLELYSKILTAPSIQEDNILSKHNLHLIPCKDGVFNSLTFETRQANKEDRFFSYINVSVSEIGASDGLIFERFIETLSNGDSKIRQLLLEVIGIIISQYQPKCFFTVFGPTNTGKTQFLSLCKMLVGENCCTSVSNLNSFSEKWTVGNLLGKKLCLCPDVSNVTLTASTVAILKQLTGDDFIHGEEKYKRPFSFVNEATLLFSSNYKLKLKNSAIEKAFLERIVSIPFLNAVPSEQRIFNLSEKLFQERGYIIGKAIEALYELRKRNFEFTKVESDFWEEDIQFEQETYIRDFISKHCVFSDTGQVSTQDLYDAFSIFCEENAIPLCRFIEFARKISGQFPQLEKTRNANKTGTRGFVGIALASDIT